MRQILRVTLASLTVVLVTALPARGQESGWVIESFDVTIDVRSDATFTVTEVIAVDFRDLERRGIFRDIPVRYEVPPAPPYPLPDEDLGPDDYLRVIEIDDIEASSDTAPDDVDLTRPGPTGGSWLRIRIGDPDVTISGRHTYRIRYDVRGAFDRLAAAPELFWDVTGEDWEAPILSVSATVRGPAPAQAGCFRGVYGATATCDSTIAEGTAVFSAEELRPGEGMTISVRYPDGAVDVPPPLLEERWSFARALTGSPWAVPLTILTAIVGLAGVGLLLYREGRDRVARGTVTVDGRVDRAKADDRRRGLFEPRPVPVRFRPPDDLRPAQIGLVIDESVDEVDVSATIVDLAVRGHLRIEEVEDEVLWFSRTDWRLVRTDPRERGDVPEEVAGRELLRYEELLLDGLFGDGAEVLVSDLKGSFHADYEKVERALYEDGRLRRWFTERPDKVRGRWLAVGVAATIAAIALLVAAVLFTTVALAAVPLVLTGLVLAAGHRFMPRRTARGSQLLVAGLGFREFVATAEAERLRFAEAEGLFQPYLPYAVVFGATERWARAFAELDAAAVGAAAGWYVGDGMFDAARFSSGLSEFSGSVGSSLATVPASSGSGGGGGGGFSGGGFGGGGGGSW